MILNYMMLIYSQGILTDKIGLRATTFTGGVLMTLGMILSSIFYHNIQLLYLTYGIMFGLGAALSYTPTIAIMGHYFKRYLGVVSGIATCGSSIFTVILPPVLTWLLDKYGLQGTFFILGISSAGVILCSLVYKPLRPPPPPPKRKPGQSSTSIMIMHLKSLVHVENFKRKRYIIWALSMPIALLGYFVPYVHMPRYIQKTYPDCNKDLPIMCIGMTSGLGRLFFGYIADFKWINRVLLQTVSFALLGLLMIAIPFVELISIPIVHPFYILLAIALGMGIVDGCFITLIGPVAYGSYLLHKITLSGYDSGLHDVPFRFIHRYLWSKRSCSGNWISAWSVFDSDNHRSTDCWLFI